MRARAEVNKSRFIVEDVIQLLGAGDQDKFKRLRRAMTLASIGFAAYETMKHWYAAADGLVTNTVTVPMEDEIYPDVHRAVLQLMKPTKRRSLIARSSFVDRNDDPEDFASGPSGNARRRGAISLLYDGKREQKIEIGGHRVKVIVARDDEPVDYDTKKRAVRRSESIVFTARNEIGRKAVLTWLLDIADARHVSQPTRLYVGNGYGWNHTGDRILRPLDTVVLQVGQLERIHDDLLEFISREKDYVERGMPWHRGYLFYGPPGTGKTSLAKALGDALELDTYFLPLADLRDDSSLVESLSRVPPRSILLLEDVDIARAAKETGRDDDMPGVSLSGLLQALDGMVTPHGLITIMTTNYVDRLDTALVRAGRVDVREEIGYATAEQAERLVERMTGVEVSLPVGPIISPAELMEPIKRHLHEPALAAAEIEDLFLEHRNDT